MGGTEGVILCRICSIVAENWVRDRIEGEGSGGGCWVRGEDECISNECIWVNVKL